MADTSLSGVFYIVRGGYDHSKAPRFFNEVSETQCAIGGYDPEDTTNREWYMLMDNVLFMCQAASGDFDKVLESLRKLVVKYKTKEHYLEVMQGVDFKVSKSQRRIEQEVFKTYGDYYTPEVEDAVEEAYKYLRENTAFAKARKRVKLRRVNKT